MKTHHYGLLLSLLPALCLAEPLPEDTCASFLSLLNRPTVADSVCVVKPGKVVVELGVQYQDLYPGSGHENNFPDSQLRFGLPWSTEFTILPPNYVRDYGMPEGTVSGNTATVAGLKHQFNDSGNWLYGLEGLFTLPTGSDNLGSDGLGFAFSGLVNYTVNSNLSFALMLGVSTQTTPTEAGGDRYTSVNPDLVTTWQFNKLVQVYLEFYGQTKTGPDQGSGFNADTGLQYLPFENVELDLEYGQRLSGELTGFARYVGVGGGLRF